MPTLVFVAVAVMAAVRVLPAQDAVLATADFRNTAYDRGFADGLPAGGPLAGLSAGLEERWYDLSTNFDTNAPVVAMDALLAPLTAGNTNSLLVRNPVAASTLDTALAFDDATMATRSGGAMGSDLQAGLWTGFLDVGGESQVPTGVVSFAVSSGENSVLYVDRDGDGVFSVPGEQVVALGSGIRAGMTTLAEIGRYRIAFAFYDRSGPASVNLRFAAGPQVNYADMLSVDPAHPAQAGLWSFQSAAAAMFGGNVMRGGIDDPSVSGTPTNDVGQQLVHSRFGMPVFSRAADFYFGDIIVPDPILLVDRSLAPTWEPANRAFYEPDTDRLYATDPGLITVHWKQAGGVLVAGIQYLIASVPAPGTIPGALYHTHFGRPLTENPNTRAPHVDVTDVPTVNIRYNSAIPDAALVARSGNVLYARLNEGLVLLEYRNDSTFLGVQVVDVRANVPDGPRIQVHIGDRLLPQNIDASMDTPQVTKGLGPFVYRHQVAASSQDGHVFSVRRTSQSVSSEDIEIYWMKRGVPDSRDISVVWPYELRRYTADWPVNDPAKYQRYVVGSTDAGPKVILPAGLSATLEPYQNPAGHAGVGEYFSAAGSGWSLLKYAPGDDVLFQVVRSTPHNDGAVFDLSPVPWEIGSEITNALHEGSFPGFVYAPQGNRYAARTIAAEAIYGPPDALHGWSSGQIFPVNTGVLEVWWANVRDGVQWPSSVRRYACEWPADPGTVVVASTLGTGALPANYDSVRLYYQNDPLLPGFNPNDEHAVEISGIVYPLRDDLGSAFTSLPYVLLSYKDTDNSNRWAFRAFDVVAEQDPYFFAYPSSEAGKLIQPPLPLSGMPGFPSEKSNRVSGPAFRDRTGRLWAHAAGDDGNAATVVMRYFYQVQSSFFFPGAGPHPVVGTEIPWLDERAGTPGVPINVSYDIVWPDDPAALSIGETLVEQKTDANDRPLPNIAQQKSVQIVYDQFAANNTGKSSLRLIDFKQQRAVPLDYSGGMPADLKSAIVGTDYFFTDAPPHLRYRLKYDGLTHQLKLSGAFLGPDGPRGYVLMNVLSDRERDTLRTLSADGDWQGAVDAMAALPVIEPGPEDRNDESFAVTAGLADGPGWVTLVFNNASNSTSGVSLELFRVECPIFRGALNVVVPQDAGGNPVGNPFDEQITLRHSGDFAGQADAYEFEWRWRAPNADGSAPALDVYPPATWNGFAPEPASGFGALDVTIHGPGLFALRDNFLICRYRPRQAPFVCTEDAEGWSVWTEPQLAEGYIKRVLRAINPFEQRIQDTQNAGVNTLVSMISQAGPRWIGSVPLSPAAAEDFGLIEIYETVLNRGVALSIEGIPPADDPGANQALLLAAGRIADLYMLLGNEAFADAADPTIAFGTDEGTYGNQATSLFAFQNQVATLLDEELALLRGRDQAGSHPVYNRLTWNFTGDINGGLVAYALNYDIRDQVGDVDGNIDQEDAEILYPQAHGDAWGHYLTAITAYYRLIRNDNFTWSPRTETVLVGGNPVEVDFLDERKFARAASARARTGAEIVGLTYREKYEEDPELQLSAYGDSDSNRGWGLHDWAARAGQGALLDWVVGNALLPDESTKTGIQKIDRSTVTELREIPSAFQKIQAMVDQADDGLNPLGLAKNVLPFDISPAGILAGKTHFEQIADRAEQALVNAQLVFNHAVDSSRNLRSQSNSELQFNQFVQDREADFNSRLIDVFGSPYIEDIGPTGAYPADYDGADIYHYAYVDTESLTGIRPPPGNVLTLNLSQNKVLADGSVVVETNTVPFNLAGDSFELTKPAGFTRRQSPGEIQRALSGLIQTRLQFDRALQTFNNQIERIESQASLIEEQYAVNQTEVRIIRENNDEVQRLNDLIFGFRVDQLMAYRASQAFSEISRAEAEALPQSVGVGSSDVTSSGRAALLIAGAYASQAEGVLGDISAGFELNYQNEKEAILFGSQVEVVEGNQGLALLHELNLLNDYIRDASALKVDLYALREALLQASDAYLTTLAQGLRLIEERGRFRAQTAEQTQARRYKDMAFRIFRDEALQKYRAQFDLAARYVYLAAKAYDFDTNFAPNDNRGAGQDFLASIVRSRTLGTSSGGSSSGLLGHLSDMLGNFGVLEGQLGFNNAQYETRRFSLRRENFRISSSRKTGGEQWKELLKSRVVDDLLVNADFKRYCSPFSPTQASEPGIILEFSTEIKAGNNFFGWPAGGGDGAYNSSFYSTKIFSVFVEFVNYPETQLQTTPQAYLVPVGNDVFRSPLVAGLPPTPQDPNARTREWKVLDQVLPVPNVLGAVDIERTDYRPDESLSGDFIDVRRYPSFLAYSASSDPSTRLVGRSVWNTRWVMIIPAATLLSDRQQGLELFIDNVTDINIEFRTYSQ